jgi:hypothetical protein
MSPTVGDINFWVSGDFFPKFFLSLLRPSICRCRKVILGKCQHYHRNDAIVDSDEAYNDHYHWATCQHHLKRRRRYTLKAEPDRSFQPQNIDQNLINILPFLINQGLSLDAVRQGLRAGFNSKPLKLGFVALSLYNWLEQYAPVKLNGTQLYKLRKDNPHLASL